MHGANRNDSGAIVRICNVAIAFEQPAETANWGETYHQVCAAMPDKSCGDATSIYIDWYGTRLARGDPCVRIAGGNCG